MKPLTQTSPTMISLAILLLRCMTGAIMFGAGAGKVVKWFGGFGMDITLQYYKQMGFSNMWTYVSSFTEFLGGALLIVGLLTRPAAFLIFINMLVATIVTMPKGFLAGQAAFPFSLMVSALIIFITGPLRFSIDALIGRHRRIIASSKHSNERGRIIF